MVLHGLNPLLRKQGFARGLRPDQVIGVATLLGDRDGRLYKDSALLGENPCYAGLDQKSLRTFRLTRYLQFPVPVYSGKVACILDAVGRNPYLCVGDSPADHPMMRVSQHRLWIARLDQPESQRATAALIRDTGNAGWILQAVSAGGGPRFLSSLEGSFDVRNAAAELRQSAAILRRLDRQLSAVKRGGLIQRPRSPSRQSRARSSHRQRV